MPSSGSKNDTFLIAGDFSTVLNGDITLYARYIPAADAYTIRFNTNSGSAVVDIVVAVNTQIGFMDKNPTKSGFIFRDWFTNVGLTDAVSSYAFAVTGNITLYVKWESASNMADYMGLWTGAQDRRRIFTEQEEWLFYGVSNIEY